MNKCEGFVVNFLMIFFFVIIYSGCPNTASGGGLKPDTENGDNSSLVYTVTFDSVGGSVVDKITNIKKDAKITKPVDPKKQDYIFEGWYKEETYINKWNFAADTVTDNIKLYARWVISGFTVIFDSQNGSTVDSITGVQNETKIYAPLAPEKVGYVFDGWYKDSQCINFWDFDKDSVTENITLYAKWIQKIVLNLGDDYKTGLLKKGEKIYYNFKIEKDVHYALFFKDIGSGPDAGTADIVLDITSKKYWYWRDIDLPASGTPYALLAEENGFAEIKVQGISDSEEGTFSLRVVKVDKIPVNSGEWITKTTSFENEEIMYYFEPEDGWIPYYISWSDAFDGGGGTQDITVQGYTKYGLGGGFFVRDNGFTNPVEYSTNTDGEKMFLVVRSKPGIAEGSFKIKVEQYTKLSPSSSFYDDGISSYMGTVLYRVPVQKNTRYRVFFEGKKEHGGYYTNIQVSCLKTINSPVNSYGNYFSKESTVGSDTTFTTDSDAQYVYLLAEPAFLAPSTGSFKIRIDKY